MPETHYNFIRAFPRKGHAILQRLKEDYGPEWTFSKHATTPPAAQPAPVQPATWQPIETAPKDFVTEFDGWNGKRVPDVSWARPEFNQRGDYAWCVQQYENGYGWANVEVKGLTHWRPIPAAPEKGGV